MANAWWERVADPELPSGWRISYNLAGQVPRAGQVLAVWCCNLWYEQQRVLAVNCPDRAQARAGALALWRSQVAGQAGVVLPSGPLPGVALG